MLYVRGLSFKYPQSENYALKDITFSVKEGEFVLLIGPSGSSKTTLLQLLKPQLGLDGDKEGEIVYRGKRICDADDKLIAGEIGYVSQIPEDQIITDRVKSEIAFGLEYLDLSSSQIESLMAETCEFFGLGNFFDRKTDSLSEGQKQILNLAAVFALKPRILLLDEPLTVLDPKSREMFLNILYKANSDLGTSVILAEQNFEDLFERVNRVIFMENGRIMFNAPSDTVAEILNGEPKNDKKAYLPLSVKAGYCLGAGEPLFKIKQARELLKCKTFPSENKINVYKPRPFVEEAYNVRNCYFKYDKDSDFVIKNCSLKIPSGKITAVMGSNGSGKSTFLKLLAGIYKPVAGKVKRKPELKVSYLPQQVKALFIQSSVKDELLVSTNKEPLHNSFLSLYGTTLQDREDAVGFILKQIGLDSQRKRHPFDLSRGEMQRLAVAKVLLTEADIYLMDEPTTGLDVNLKRGLRDILLKLKDLNKTIVLVSHDIEFCAFCSQFCGFMFDKKITALSSNREFFNSNYFYTTKAKLITRGIADDIITEEELINYCERLKSE